MEKISILQILIGTTAFALLINGLMKFLKREKGQTLFKILANTIVWGGISAFSFFPRLSHTLTSLLGFGENLNTLIFLGFIIVFAILFKIINVVERIEKNISQMVRKEALDKIQQKNSHE